MSWPFVHVKHILNVDLRFFEELYNVSLQLASYRFYMNPEKRGR